MNEYTKILKGKIVSEIEKSEGCLKIHFSDGTILESISQSEDLDYSSDMILEIMEPRISTEVLNESNVEKNIKCPHCKKSDKYEIKEYKDKEYTHLFQCKNCQKDYLENENFNWSCRTHQSDYGGEIWWCCGKTGLN